MQWKQTKVVVGTKAANRRLRGAQAPGRDLFVYRVDKEVTTLEIAHYVKNNGVELRNASCISHNDAMYKSFKLTVPVTDMPTLLDAALWPKGIMVRRYRTRYGPE